jgi:hypothetical protein
VEPEVVDPYELKETMRRVGGRATETLGVKIAELRFEFPGGFNAGATEWQFHTKR